jgi:hypothetical protein
VGGEASPGNGIRPARDRHTEVGCIEASVQSWIARDLGSPSGYARPRPLADAGREGGSERVALPNALVADEQAACGKQVVKTAVADVGSGSRARRHARSPRAGSVTAEQQRSVGGRARDGHVALPYRGSTLTSHTVVAGTRRLSGTASCQREPMGRHLAQSQARRATGRQVPRCCPGRRAYRCTHRHRPFAWSMAPPRS